MKQVEKGIFELIKSLVGGRVYLDLAPDNVTFPCIIINRTGSTRWNSLSGSSGMAVAYIDIMAVAGKPYDAKEIGGQIESILDGYRGVVTYDNTQSPPESVRIAACLLQGDTVEIDQEDEPVLYKNTLSFNITYAL